MYVQVCRYVGTYVLMYVCTCIMYTYIYIYMYVCIYIYAYPWGSTCVDNTYFGA